MLCISRGKEDQVNLYLVTPNGPRPLGCIKHLGRASDHQIRLGFDMAPDVLIARDEIDNLKQERTLTMKGTDSGNQSS